MPDRPLNMPGCTALTRLKVYETPGPDGQLGGTPHVHLACSEMYYVIAGSGAVELIDARGFSRVELPLHSALVFTPGTLHRLINPARDLELLIIMQNSGLPERGDTLATFKSPIIADELAYFKAMRAGSLPEAYRRRDEAVAGFLEIKAAFERSLKDGRAALETLFRLGIGRTSSKYQDWYQCVASGAFAEAQATLSEILELGHKKIGHLFDSRHAYYPPAESNTVGFCGHLNRYFHPASLWPEGVVS